MSANYSVKGSINLNIPIDDYIQMSQSATDKEIIDFVVFCMCNRIGSCDINEIDLKVERR